MYEVIAEQYLCFPALIEMVIKNLTGRNIGQYEIAEWLGITVPYHYSGKVKNVTKSIDCYEYGVHIDVNRIKDYFEEKQISLKVDYIEISKIKEDFFQERIQEYIQQNKTLICSYSYGYLYGREELIQVGHVSQILSTSEMDIDIYDPGPDGVGKKKVNEFLLYDAIQYKNGGIYIFY